MKPGDRCPSCVIGLLGRLELVTHVSPEPDTLAELHEMGLVCSVCGAEYEFKLLGGDRRAVAELFGARCDFCGEPDPVIELPCGAFEVDGADYQGAFAACATCKGLVEADDREGLISRAIYRFAERNPAATTFMIARGLIPGSTVRRIQAGFWEHRQ
jgi:hypothetical protein